MFGKSLSWRLQATRKAKHLLTQPPRSISDSSFDLRILVSFVPSAFVRGPLRRPRLARCQARRVPKPYLDFVEEYKGYMCEYRYWVSVFLGLVQNCGAHSHGGPKSE